MADSHDGRRQDERVDEIDPSSERAAEAELPLERAERQLREWKLNNSPDIVSVPAIGRIGPITTSWVDAGWSTLTEVGKLGVVEVDIDWTGVRDRDKYFGVR